MYSSHDQDILEPRLASPRVIQRLLNIGERVLLDHGSDIVDLGEFDSVLGVDGVARGPALDLLGLGHHGHRIELYQAT